MSALERRIIETLDGEARSDVIALIISEMEKAIAEADVTAEGERQKAVDPALSPDPKAARAATEDATFAASRLRTLLPRLKARYAEREEHEAYAAWRARFEPLEQQRNALASEFAELYPKVAGQLVELFERMLALDKEISGHDQVRRSGWQGHLEKTEFVAHGSRVKGFPISQQIRLPNFDSPDQMIWPPPQPSLGVQYLIAMGKSVD